MTDKSGKWAIFEVAPGTYRIEFYDPTGTDVVARVNFNQPAIEEFQARLNEVVTR